MPVYSVWLINKAGGLIYQKTITEGFHPKLTSNDYLVVASTFQRYEYEGEEPSHPPSLFSLLTIILNTVFMPSQVESVPLDPVVAYKVLSGGVRSLILCIVCTR